MRSLVAGVDIGNNTTEVALAELDFHGGARFLASAQVPTTGIKGTPANVHGVVRALQDALLAAGRRMDDLSMVYLNEATPVIADVAMETLTETVITESTMIGHNPATPGGKGIGTGRVEPLAALAHLPPGEKVIAVVDGSCDFRDAAAALGAAMGRGLDVQGAIVQRDDGVLIVNRLPRPIPVVDEVARIDQVPLHMPGAIEVAEPGRSITFLNNPYGIATLFGLNPAQTRNVVPVARALSGNRSAVVIKTPGGQVTARRIPAGHLTVMGGSGRLEVDVAAGAGAIMAAVSRLQPLADVEGEPGTNVGGMIQRVRQTMAELTGQAREAVHIQDVLAVDTFVPQRVVGGLAEEFSRENAVALGAMVKTSRLPMREVAARVERETRVPVTVAGQEAAMAILGALTTPGTDRPLAMLDMGGGSTDAALITADGRVTAVHMAGAGDLVTMLIDSELALDDRGLAEEIKRHPLAKAESLFHIRQEDGTVRFLPEPLDPQLFGRVVLLDTEGMKPVPVSRSVAELARVRREAKRKVFVANALRALERVAPAGNIRTIPFVVFVGGSALDFEIPGLVADALAHCGIVAGRGNVRGTEGPRNAVATGLVLSQARSPVRGG